MAASAQHVERVGVARAVPATPAATQHQDGHNMEQTLKKQLVSLSAKSGGALLAIAVLGLAPIPAFSNALVYIGFAAAATVVGIAWTLRSLQLVQKLPSHR